MHTHYAVYWFQNSNLWTQKTQHPSLFWIVNCNGKNISQITNIIAHTIKVWVSNVYRWTDHLLVITRLGWWTNPNILAWCLPSKKLHHINISWPSKYLDWLCRVACPQVREVQKSCFKATFPRFSQIISIWIGVIPSMFSQHKPYCKMYACGQTG